MSHIIYDIDGKEVKVLYEPYKDETDGWDGTVYIDQIEIEAVFFDGKELIGEEYAEFLEIERDDIEVLCLEQERITQQNHIQNAAADQWHEERMWG